MSKEWWANKSTSELKRMRDEYRAKIDGPENDHRVTADGSASLDFWMDMIEEINEELFSRGVNGV